MSSKANAGLNPRVNRRFLLKLVAVPVVMFGFGYLMVPLYTVFCSVTGLNGKTGSISVEQASKLAASTSAESREVKVQFISSINQNGLWEFRPTETSMMVQTGKSYSTAYFARNLSNQAAVTQSVPSVSPSKAATYFNKSACFCFTEQAFKPNESREMGLTFVVDPGLPEDVDAIVLSYTLFTKSLAKASDNTGLSKDAGEVLGKNELANAGPNNAIGSAGHSSRTISLN